MNDDALKNYSGGIKTAVHRSRPGNGNYDDKALVLWGWITTAFFTPVGIVLSIILLARGNRTGHGGAMLAIGIIWATIIIVMMSKGAADATDLRTYNDCIIAGYAPADCEVK